MTRLVTGLLVSLVVTGGATAAGGNPCVLPAALTRALVAKVPDAQVLTLADLAPEHRKLFLHDHPNQCPGRVDLSFYGGSSATALSLVGPGKGVLVVARPEASTWSIDVLDQGNAPGVVWKEPPGEYKDIYEEARLHLRNEGLVWCGYESWAILYGWVDGRVQKIWLAD